MMTRQSAEMTVDGWRLTVQPQGAAYVWWIVSPGPEHKVVKYDIALTFNDAVHVSRAVLRALLRKPVPEPTIKETP